MKPLPILLLLLFAPGVLVAEEIRQLDVESEDNTYKISVDVFVDAKPRDVMYVLTNFNHLDWISGGILDSRLLDKLAADRYIVFVRTRACFGIFCRQFDQVQRVRRISDRELLAETIPEFSDVERNVTRWEVTAEDQGTRLIWTTEIRPGFWILPLIGDALMRNGLQRQGERTARGIEKLARERAAQHD